MNSQKQSVDKCKPHIKACYNYYIIITDRNENKLFCSGLLKQNISLLDRHVGQAFLNLVLQFSLVKYKIDDEIIMFSPQSTNHVYTAMQSQKAFWFCKTVKMFSTFLFALPMKEYDSEINNKCARFTYVLGSDSTYITHFY